MFVVYGDAVPSTVVGKLFSQFGMVVGVGLTAAFIGIVGSNVYIQEQNLDNTKGPRVGKLRNLTIKVGPDNKLKF